jgi:hypothetical protein
MRDYPQITQITQIFKTSGSLGFHLNLAFSFYSESVYLRNLWMNLGLNLFCESSLENIAAEI